MTTTSLDSRAVFSIASEMDEIHNHLRISHDMVVDQLCECTMDDLGSLEKMHERIFFLTNQIPQKLAEVMALNEKLMELGRAARLPA